ncbi:TolC family protein [Acidihalobacter prosperus]
MDDTGKALTGLGPLGMILASLCFVSPPAHAGSDPLGAYSGLGESPGRLVEAPGQQLSPLSTQLPTAWRGRPLTLAQLSALALRNNPSTRAAWENLRVQAAALGQAKSAWWPTLDLNVPLTRSQSATAAGANVPPQNTLRPNLTLSWLVWDFGQTQASVDASQAQLNAATFTQNASVQSVLSGVQQAYYQLLGDRALVTSYTEALASSKAALQAAEAKHRAGQATIADVYQARASVASAQAALAAGKQTVASDEGALASAVGLPLDTRLQLAPLDLGTPPKLRAPVQALMRQALRANPSLQSTRSRVDAAQADLRAAQRSGLPSITFGATQTWRAQNEQSPSRQYSLGLTLSVPLFSGFKRHYEEAQARASLAEARANLKVGVQSTQLSVWQDYYAFRSATAALPSARAQLDNARKALDAVQAQYRVGLATMQDLLSAQATVTSARVAVTRDAIDSYKALANLSASIGTLAPPEGALNGQ